MFGIFKKKPEVKKTEPPVVQAPPVVLPLVETLARVEALCKQVAGAHPAGPERDAWMPVVTPLAGDLCIAYTCDLAELSKLVVDRDLPALGVARDALHALSLRNLRKHVQGKLTINQVQDLFLIAGLRGLEASLLAVPEVWDGIGSQFGGEVHAAVPFAGIVIAYVEPAANASRDRKVAGKRARDSFLAESREALRTAKEHPLSSHAFAWRDGGWVSLGSIEPSQAASDSLKTTFRCPGCGSDQFVKTGGVFDEESLKCVGCGAVLAHADVAAAIAKEAARLGADDVSVDVVWREPNG
jgi:hypothetical protein